MMCPCKASILTLWEGIGVLLYEYEKLNQFSPVLRFVFSFKECLNNFLWPLYTKKKYCGKNSLKKLFKGLYRIKQSSCSSRLEC